MARFSDTNYLSVTIDFRCNLKCVHCMIEDTMDNLKPVGLDQFSQVLERRLAQRTDWEGLVLTGAEATLNRDLVRYIEVGKSKGFEKIRIQTHGMKLSEPDFVKRVVEAGANEFFVSIPAAKEETYEAITKVPGSYRKTLQGLRNLSEYPHVSVITNTVVTQLSYQEISAVIELLKDISSVKQTEFWNYFPMAETDKLDLLVSYDVLRPHFIKMLNNAQSYELEVVLKNYPSCLMRDKNPQPIDNTQPTLVIDSTFWNSFAENNFGQCLYRGICGSELCMGLTTAYINKFGWDENLLSPIDADFVSDKKESYHKPRRGLRLVSSS